MLRRSAIVAAVLAVPFAAAPAAAQEALARIESLSVEAAAELQTGAITAYGCVIPFEAAGLYSIYAVHHAAEQLGVEVDGLEQPIFMALMVLGVLSILQRMLMLPLRLILRQKRRG